MTTDLEHSADEAAYSIVRQQSLLKYLKAQVDRDAIDAVNATEYDDVKSREEQYQMVRAFDALVGRLENMAYRAEQRRKKNG